MALVKCPHCQHTVSDVASVCPACRANLTTARTGQRRDSGQTMLCSRCSARLPTNAPVCCNCGVLEPKPKRSFFRPAMVGLAAALALLIVAIGSRFGRSPAPVIAAASPAPAPAPVESEANPPVATPLRAAPPPPAQPPRLEPPPNTVRRWTSTWVNVRDGRGTNNAVVATLDPGVPVEVYDRQQSWWAVIDAGRHIGYVANSVLLPAPPDAVAPEMEPPLVSQRAGR